MLRLKIIENAEMDNHGNSGDYHGANQNVIKCNVNWTALSNEYSGGTIAVHVY